MYIVESNIPVKRTCLHNCSIFNTNNIFFSSNTSKNKSKHLSSSVSRISKNFSVLSFFVFIWLSLDESKIWQFLWVNPSKRVRGSISSNNNFLLALNIDSWSVSSDKDIAKRMTIFNQQFCFCTLKAFC